MGGVFFFGIALTFVLVAVVPRPRGRMTWAFIPATVLALLGGVVMLGWNSAFNYAWAFVLIAAGLYLLYRRLGGEIFTRS